MTPAPDYRVASVWLAVNDAKRVNIPLVVLPQEEEVAAAKRIKSIRVCCCDVRPEPHIHTRTA